VQSAEGGGPTNKTKRFDRCVCIAGRSSALRRFKG